MIAWKGLGGIWPFRRPAADAAAARLLDTVARISRQPGFFGQDRTPDTLEGRLEIVFLHAILALRRLKAEPGARPLSQAFTDQVFAYFDGGLREAGVGDLTVPKRMRKVADSFYGRLEAYGRALEGADEPGLAAAIGRNVFGKALAPPFAFILARYAAETEAALAGAPLARLEQVDSWRAAPG
jgi:cytochrome b pre-mRNA-processing protein 3